MNDSILLPGTAEKNASPSMAANLRTIIKILKSEFPDDGTNQKKILSKIVKIQL